MKVLVIIGHPNLEKSKANKAWKEEVERNVDVLQKEKDVEVDIHVITASTEYDVKAEQERLTHYDRVVLQFPFYLYTCPAFMWTWLHEVFAYGWAYGKPNGALVGKEMGVAVTIGGPSFSYRSGDYNDYTIDEYLRVFERIATLCGMKYLPCFTIYDSMRRTPEQLDESARNLVDHISDRTLGGPSSVL